MFKRANVKKTLKCLSNEYPCFVSEAQFQLIFAFKAYIQLGNKFSFYPEWPCTIGEDDKTDHIDLMIIDNETQEKTLIEFKYKTKKDCSYTLPPGLEVIPSNMGARSIAKYDCWKDIQRLEKHVDNREASNGFFIFLTNDSLYWKEKNVSKVY